MKIALSAQGISLEVEVSDYKAITVYRGLAEKLLIHAKLQKTTEIPKALNEPEVVITRPDKKSSLDTYDDVFEHIRSAIKAEQRIEIESGQEDDEDLPEEPAEENAPPQEPDMTDKPKGYKGFLMIRCKGCGHVSTFCSKHELNWYKCQECGEKTTLEDLRLIWAKCECGQRAHYYTNVDDPVTEVNCLACGAPVAVGWNPKKKCYQTIAERQI